MQEGSPRAPTSSSSTAPSPSPSSPAMSSAASTPPASSSRSSSANGRGQNSGNNPAHEVKKDVPSSRGGKSGKSPASSRGGKQQRHHHHHHQSNGPPGQSPDHGRGGQKHHLVHHHGGGRGRRSRGGGCGGGWRAPAHPRPDGGQQGPPEMTRADEFEVGSVFNAGSKKQNLNHLLNFQFEPRGVGNSNYHQHRRSSGEVKKKGSQTSRPKYKKEQYLQANCQFIVRAGGDYDAHMTDPDTLVEWGLVEQVGLKSSAGVPSCPICLYPPTAAKIARCGHVFCWSCILHYLALSDHAFRKCPICYDSIYKDDLKSVVSLVHSEFQVGDEIEMLLMRRERHSLFAVPVSSYHPDINIKHPSVSTKSNTSYSQLLIASPVEVANIIVARERKELEEQYRNEKDEPESCFIEEALSLLSQRESGLLLDKSSVEVGLLPTLNEDQKPEEGSVKEVQPAEEEEEEDLSSKNASDEESGAGATARPRHTSSSSETSCGAEVEEEEYLDADVVPADLDLSSVQPANMAREEKEASNQPAPKDTFYFYQSSDGQAIFLHALNVQMLVLEHGSLENCPPVIRGRVLEKDATSMSEELRNKLRYLRHLPLTCSFEVCELDLTGQVSDATVAEFAGQLDARRRRRGRRAREEKRRERKIQMEENKRMGKYPERMMRIESWQHYPPVGDLPPFSSGLPSLRRSSESLNDGASSVLGTSPRELLGVTASACDDDPLVVEPGTSVAPPDGATAADINNSNSFANILRKGPGTFTDAKMRRSHTFPSSVSAAADSETEEDGASRPPPPQNLSDLFDSAFDQLAKKKSESGDGNNDGVGGAKAGKKKGRKNKGVNLFQPVRPSF